MSLYQFFLHLSIYFLSLLLSCHRVLRSIFISLVFCIVPRRMSVSTFFSTGELFNIHSKTLLALFSVLSFHLLFIFAWDVLCGCSHCMKMVPIYIDNKMCPFPGVIIYFISFATQRAMVSAPSVTVLTEKILPLRDPRPNSQTAARSRDEIERR